MKRILHFLFICFTFSCSVIERDKDQEILSLLTGMYAIESWYDGDSLHMPPAVSGRWVFYEGKIMSSIHNRTKKNNYKSSFKWGHGTVVGEVFSYTYTETLNIKGTQNSAKMNLIKPWVGMRTFNVKIKNNELIMTSSDGKQIWTITKEGMIYSDSEWGDDKIFVKRKWKRLTSHNEKI